MTTIVATLSNRSCRRTALLYFMLALALPGARPSLAADSSQRTFSTADEAAQALAAALKAHDPKAVLAVLGKGDEPIVDDRVPDIGVNNPRAVGHTQSHGHRDIAGVVQKRTGRGRLDHPFFMQRLRGWYTLFFQLRGIAGIRLA